MPILGIKVGGNWNWKSGKKKRNQAAFSVIGGDIIENGEMGLIKSKEHAWHGEEFYQITGSYENCNPQYWEFKECDHHMGSYTMNLEINKNGLNFYQKKAEKLGYI